MLTQAAAGCPALEEIAQKVVAQDIFGWHRKTTCFQMREFRNAKKQQISS